MERPRESTLEEKVLHQIWGVFNDANKEHEPMLCGDDEKKIHVFLKAYVQSQLKERDGKYVNMYKDEAGRFLSDQNYTTHEQAYECRDKLSTYVDTIQIIRTPQKQ